MARGRLSRDEASSRIANSKVDGVCTNLLDRVGSNRPKRIGTHSWNGCGGIVGKNNIHGEGVQVRNCESVNKSYWGMYQMSRPMAGVIVEVGNTYTFRKVSDWNGCNIKAVSGMLRR